MSGWIRLHRGWRDCDVFGDEPMTEREAWVWLIEKAAWKACVRRNAKGERVQIDRGQFHTSFRNLGTAWRWGKNRVSRFLERLEEHEMIGTVAGQSGCTITICNYDVYQDMRDSHPQETGTVAGQSRDTQEEGKEYKEDKYTSEAKASSVDAREKNPFPRPEWADAQVWSDFLKNRRRKKQPNTETAYRKFLADIARHAGTDWPPGRLLEYATAKGWGGIYDPRKENQNEMQFTNPEQPQRIGRTAAAANAVRARLRAL